MLEARESCTVSIVSVTNISRDGGVQGLAKCEPRIPKRRRMAFVLQAGSIIYFHPEKQGLCTDSSLATRLGI